MAKLNYKTPSTLAISPAELAMSYIDHGWPVFPCRNATEEAIDPQTGEVITLNEKTPRTSNGFKGATKTRRIIDRWWSDWPDSAVGIPTGAATGVFVLDIDNKPGGANGFNWLAEMEAEHGPLPETARVTTPNGGLHIYFNYVVGTRNRGSLGSGVDIRSEGGYVLAAGSLMADGRVYKWEPNADQIPEVADAPQWLLDLLLPKHQPSIGHHYSPSAIGNSAYVEAAISSELNELAMAPEGTRNNRLNDAAFALGQFVGAGALAHSEAERELQDIAQQWGNFPKSCGTIRRGLMDGAKHPRHIPEPDFHHDNTRLVDLTRMIQNGIAKGKKDEGTAVIAHKDYEPEEGIASDPEVHDAVDTAPEPESHFRATKFEWIDPSKLPRREFAFGTHYIRKYVSVTVSPGGLGKTSNSIVEALAMVSGRQLAGVKPKERLNVWLFNAEDPRDEMQRRIMAACLHYGLKAEDIEGRLFLDTGREQELIVMHEDKKTGLKVNEPVVESVVEQIERHKIDVMIVDPFVSTHRVNENDNGAIDKVAKLWAQIADVTNCAVDVVHHLKKLADREATVEDARGAVSLIGAARSVRVLNRMSEEQATKAGIDPAERFSYFWIHHGKVNLTKMDSTEHWRKLESVSLGNGSKNPLRLISEPHDTAGVVTEWTWPSKDEIASSVPDDVRRAVLVRLENQNYRESAQSEDWAGYVLAEAMGTHLETNRAMTAEKRKIKSVLDSWIGNGILAVVDEPDPKHLGRKIKYVRPSVEI